MVPLTGAAGPRLTRIRMVTTAAPDIDAIVPLYLDWLDMTVADEGLISGDLARSWDAPAAEGRRHALLRSGGAEDVFVRFVETDAPAGYQSMTTYGWNAWEIIVDDPYKLHDDRLTPSPFTVIGPPRPLDSIPSIHATQVTGPAGEVLYLTAETGDRDNSLLPRPGAFVGRPFIVVVAGPDVSAVRDWYCDTFAIERRPINDRQVGILTTALGLPPGRPLPLSIGRLAQHGNLIEFDGYTGGDNLVGARPRVPGQLPPGTAMASFGVDSLDDLALDWITPPRPYADIGYDGRRAATTRGAAGELVELIEE